MTAATPDYRLLAALLGVVQILTWGSSFYLLAILAPPIVQDTGWSAFAVTGGISIALATSALMAGTVGREINRRGGRLVLCAGVGVMILGLVALALAPSLPVYILAWVVIGAAMAATLYEAAFSMLSQVFGGEARRAITSLTLIGGFSATICWPLSALLVEAIGWRGTCAAYAGLHLLVTLPICRFGLPQPAVKTPETAEATDDTDDTAPIPWRDPRLLAVAIAGVCLVFIFSAMAMHLPSLLMAQGHTLAQAAALGAVIGPSQVGARLIEMLGGGRHSPVTTMVVSTLCVAAGLLSLSLSAPAALCLITYGMGLGLWTIARGTVPLGLFGPKPYAATMARLALPVLTVSALAPLVGLGMLPALGPTGTLLALTAIACVPLALSLFLWRQRPR
ncbi:MFS transporter [Gymnodinialimonas ceratoperidinii]|uniref:MFS transporter n=1 Tax=Gymnodinialimonas ceratoperidinii TaxID=2856823 RepID=A0A8F6YDM9_9RHOB|nr:MFS transporter [Gymnodinialimonas ceratoperidinii]QXT40357.1 MFS transporter [Gymnodinialimonas ceratoperidinii]